MKINIKCLTHEINIAPLEVGKVTLNIPLNSNIKK